MVKINYKRLHTWKTQSGILVSKTRKNAITITADSKNDKLQGVDADRILGTEKNKTSSFQNRTSSNKKNLKRIIFREKQWRILK